MTLKPQKLSAENLQQSFSALLHILATHNKFSRHSEDVDVVTCSKCYARNKQMS
jgi:hypothetical protein